MHELLGWLLVYWLLFSLVSTLLAPLVWHYEIHKNWLLVK